MSLWWRRKDQQGVHFYSASLLVPWVLVLQILVLIIFLLLLAVRSLIMGFLC